ncbi:MAG: Colicin I receptor [Stenotrophomonas maltophilia]|uniref:Colicin I receptor n=1 Tax=Stenotrophomonas maltophilia TaxID=40324 RepID=A0A7V8JM42_STEMA|nr:MAG: Colicin I receptor [Stenotrophomonas maltophilia]
MRNANHHIKPSRIPLTLAVLACLQVAPALAQESTQQEAKASSSTSSTQRATDLDKVTVTGSLIRRADYETTSPVFTINAETNAKQGQVNVAEFLQKSAIGAAETQITRQFGGFVVEGGTGVQTISLRSLGANRTLVLLDGQRPGPAGTRGAVGAFDLNVIPTAVLQRAEIVKDGSSSIYGSDAVAGVVNLITKKHFDRPELTVIGRVPTEGGGEVFSASLANGWNFEKGSVVAAAEWYRHNALTRGDRDFLNCGNDLVYDANGNRIDREDRSINRGTNLANCNNMLHNLIDVGSTRYVPSGDGSTTGPFPGYRPRTTQTYARGQAFYDEPLNFARWGQGQIINQQERKTLYLATDCGFDSVNWKTQLLFNRRETNTFSWRQFFPYVLIPGTQTEANPVLPFKSQQDVTVDYFYVASKLDGLFKGTDTWSWEVNTNFSHSKGKYGNLAIQASKSGDLDYTNTPPSVNYFDPGYLSGTKVDELVDKIGIWDWGKAIYKQATVNAVVSGDLFEMPGNAGAVGVAAGLEYRYYSLNDQPSELSRNGDIWGSSSADVTKGSEKVKEAFVELDVPLLKGLPAIESLSLNTSGRVFKYDSVSGSDNVWKVGLNWQIIPALRLRGSVGTSYRAPGLYETYLGNQTGFFSQANDPCVRWGESSNTNFQKNCAAAGIPADYAGGGSSGTVYGQGGGTSLVPETSRAKTAGIVFTPTFANLSVAIDYFDYQVNNEIAQLGSNNVMRGCYGGSVYPNSYCDLLTRNGATGNNQPYAITQIQNKFININS